MDAHKRLEYWLFAGSRGGAMRFKILQSLKLKPKNPRQLALALQVDYKTVQHHLKLLYDNGFLEMQGNGYGSVYFLSDVTEKEWKFIDGLIKGG
jgi:DNA-binding transcriptional ArsR family regulator